MVTLKQEKTLAIFTTLLVVISIFFSDKNDIVFFQEGAFIVYGIGLGSMWYNIYRKNKEEKESKYKDLINFNND